MKRNGSMLLIIVSILSISFGVYQGILRRDIDARLLTCEKISEALTNDLKEQRKLKEQQRMIAEYSKARVIELEQKQRGHSK